MKKPLSVILNILSIISAAITLILGIFLIFDWVTISSTPFVYSIDFWMIVDLYAVCMLISSAVGLAVTIPGCIITQSEKRKKISKVMIILFAVVIIISVVLYFLPFNV